MPFIPKFSGSLQFKFQENRMNSQMKPGKKANEKSKRELWNSQIHLSSFPGISSQQVLLQKIGNFIPTGIPLEENGAVPAAPAGFPLEFPWEAPEFPVLQSPFPLDFTAKAKGKLWKFFFPNFSQLIPLGLKPQRENEEKMMENPRNSVDFLGIEHSKGSNVGCVPYGCSLWIQGFFPRIPALPGSPESWEYRAGIIP